MDDINKISAEKAELENLPELLRDRLGFALGDFPNRDKFQLVGVDASGGLFNVEKLLDRVCRLDFILLDAECAYLTDLPFVLENLGKKLVNHGLILLFDKSIGDKRHSLWHRILASGEVEFLSESSFHGGSLYVFQWIKPRDAAAPLPKPLRYRIADRVSQMLSFAPGFKRFLKDVLRNLRSLGAGPGGIRS